MVLDLYLAAWDVHHARLFGRCEPTTGIAPFGRLVAQVMTSTGCSTGWTSTGPALLRPDHHARASIRQCPL